MTPERKPHAKLVLHAGLFANQQAQLAFAGAFATVATVALVISYFLAPGARVVVGLVLVGVLVAVNANRLWPTIRTHADWAERSDDEGTKHLATALRERLAR